MVKTANFMLYEESDNVLLGLGRLAILEGGDANERFRGIDGNVYVRHFLACIAHPRG